jgi:hypothetical protein
VLDGEFDDDATHFGSGGATELPRAA